MVRRLPVFLCALACLLALPAAASAGAPKGTPTVSRVTPLKLGVGDTLTINGKNFVSGRLRNVVVFQRDRARPVFIRADEATTTRIRIKIPTKLLPFLSQSGGKAVPTRFALRILAKRFGLSFTSKKLSPVIGPAALGNTPAVPAPFDNAGPNGDCDHDGVLNKFETDADNDGLLDTLEKQIKTNPCNPDTDGDTIEDGFEYESALDLNSRAVPYPGKRPYPNALDPKDAGTDYDGDGLVQSEEYTLWVRYGGHRFPLNYSDGNQFTGGPAGVPSGLSYLDTDSTYPDPIWKGIGVLSDDEKDADGDGIGNWDEIRGAFDSQNLKHQSYFPGLDYLDRDTDGDGVLDGADDQDHDGRTNVQEIQTVPFGTGYHVQHRVNYLPSNALDPCDPDISSRSCPVHPEN